MGGRPPLSPTRSGVARNAGLTEHQRKSGLPVARVPDPDFEEAIEADEPPTVTALAKSRFEFKCNSS
jgi:hypothetical protein